MEPRKSSYFTLMIMPETSAAEVRRIRVSRRWLVAAGATVALLVVLSIGSVIHSAIRWGHAQDNDVLRNENTALRSKVVALDERLEAIDQSIARLQKLDAKLRAMTMVSDPDRNLAIGPVGGGTEPLTETDLEASVGLRRDLFGPGDIERPLNLVGHRLENAERSADSAYDSAAALSALLDDQHALLTSTPSRRPSPGYVSSKYGMRIDPFTGLPQFHAGLDFSANVGGRVVSTADGVVIFAGNSGAYGKTIHVDHGNGLVSQYAHLSKIVTKVGESVKRGQLIGAVGNTGRSTGPHLHYEIRLNGIPQNPQRFLLE